MSTDIRKPVPRIGRAGRQEAPVLRLRQSNSLLSASSSASTRCHAACVCKPGEDGLQAEVILLVDHYLSELIPIEEHAALGPCFWQEPG